MHGLRQRLEHLLQKRDLSERDAAALLHELAAPEVSAAMAGSLLAALPAKGGTAPEVRGFACPTDLVAGLTQLELHDL